MSVAIGMILRGLRDSSPYITVDSNPVQDQKAMNIAKPGAAMANPLALNALTGLTASGISPSGPPPWNSTANAITARIAISVSRKIESTFAASEMSKNARTALMRMHANAKYGHGMSTPS